MTAQAVVVLTVGVEGGDITLLGRVGPGGGWQFRRTTEDQTDALLGEPEGTSLLRSAWVDGWDAALEQLDRYPWAMLYPLEVHPDFRERVRVALEERWANARAPRQVEWVREKWVAVLEGREE